MAEHQVRSEMMGQLVHRRCGELVSGSQTAEKTWYEEERAGVMNGWITEIRCDGTGSILRLNPLEVPRHFVESLVPSDALPASSSASHGMLQTIFIEVNILQGDGLRANISAAEWIVFIAADIETLVWLYSDFDPADRFAEIARAIVRQAVAGVFHGATKNSKSSSTGKAAYQRR